MTAWRRPFEGPAAGGDERATAAARPGEGAFVEFATTNAARLRRSAYLMCHDWHLAEDLTQISLTKLYLAWGRSGPPDAPLAYAHTVLVRSMLDHRRRPLSREIAVAEPPSGITDATSDLRLTLVEALRHLQQRDRVVVVLRYWEDLSVEQVAQLLGLSTTAVKARSRRALARLRELVGESAAFR